MAGEVDVMLRLLLASALAAIIGYERERRGKPAGLRTHVLIGLGAALFAAAGDIGFAGVESSRIAAGVVTGIGFLGAGAIIRREGGAVEGLTTAATMWVVAAIGLASGAGLYLVASVTTAITLIVLLLPHPVR